MLYARFALLEIKSSVASQEEPEEAIREPLLAVLHAAHHTDVQELHVLQDMLCARFSKEFAQAALNNEDGCVPERVANKVAYRMPPPDLVDAYVICRLTQLLARKYVNEMLRQFVVPTTLPSRVRHPSRIPPLLRPRRRGSRATRHGAP